MRGILMSFTSPVALSIPAIVPFQYSPAEVTRVLKTKRGEGGGSGLQVTGPPVETYTMKIELDAYGISEMPITHVRGVEPLLAAIEAMLEPVSGAGDLSLPMKVGSVPAAIQTAADIIGGPNSSAVPVPTLPLVILQWSLTRIVPVRIESFTAVENGFDDMLQPVRATVDLSFTVLRTSDFASDMAFANTMATAYQAIRASSAATGLLQAVEVAL